LIGIFSKNRFVPSGEQMNVVARVHEQARHVEGFRQIHHVEDGSPERCPAKRVVIFF
jgi:hypothetical protein